ncbi:MAG: acyl-CoA dehydrogenase family protein [Pigmentiphaga sp.]|nr:acyl-CoA dehydrogenase family protein [Pigmentiphaga sp.]
MDFSLDEDQVALREAVRRYCERSYPLQARGDPETPDLARTHWQGLAELGVLGMPIAEEWGGGGLGATEVMLASHEFGRALGGVGFVPAVVLCGHLLGAGGEALRRRWLSALAAGESRVSFACGAAEMRGDLTRPGVVASADGDGFLLRGEKAFVLEHDDSDAVLLLARTAGRDGDETGLTLFLLEPNQAGIERHVFTTLDGRRAMRLALDGVAAPAQAVLGRPHEGHALAREGVDRALAAWCSEATGAIEALFDQTLEYIKTRRQFGSALIGFQALQHRMADLLMSLELSRSMACAAAMAVEEAPPAERRRIVDAAKVFIGKAGREAGHCAIQLHGGMGMTDECRVGHYVKRLMVLDQYFGNAADHLRRLAAI